MAKLLMCRPDYYGIRYEINPWMRTSRGADPRRALAQWEDLYHTLARRLSVEVELIDPDKGWPDMVFTANAGLVLGQRFVVSNFRHKERAGEAPLFWNWFSDHGYTCIAIPKACCFEGEGDALWAGGQAQGLQPSPAGTHPPPQTLLAGYHFRSDLASHRMLAEALASRVISVELCDKRFYHLDTCIAPLDETTAIWYPPAFDEYARKAISDLFPGLIELELAEALRFGANAVVVDKSVVINSGCPKLSAQLEQRGFEVFSVDLSEFMKAGGAAKCLTLWLER
jgi:N-dimethylarginine dimethylaminohydrolase